MRAEFDETLVTGNDMIDGQQPPRSGSYQQSYLTNS